MMKNGLNDMESLRIEQLGEQKNTKDNTGEMAVGKYGKSNYFYLK